MTPITAEEPTPSTNVDSVASLRLDRPMGLRAEMARRGLMAGHLHVYWDPERGDVDPFDDEETRTAVRRFMHELWQACIAAEGSEA